MLNIMKLMCCLIMLLHVTSGVKIFSRHIATIPISGNIQIRRGMAMHDPRKCQDTAQRCEVQCTHFRATWTAWTAQFYNNAPSNARDVNSIATQEQSIAMQSSFKCVYVRYYLLA